MTIEEVKEFKGEIEKAIENLISNFNNVTGCEIKEIYVFSDNSSFPQIIDVTVKVEL